jgi:hypothetical protein
LRCFSTMPRLFFEPMDQGALPWRVTQWLAAATASTGRPLRPRRRIGAVGNQPQEACAEEPRDTGDRGCRRNAGDRAAGLRSGPHCQLAEEARAHGLVRRRALRVAPPRPGAAQGVGSQERPGRPGLTEAQVIVLEKAKTEKRHMASSRASIQVNRPRIPPARLPRRDERTCKGRWTPAYMLSAPSSSLVWWLPASWKCAGRPFSRGSGHAK